MNVNWMGVRTQKRGKMTSDVAIWFISGGDMMQVNFSTGAMALKFHHQKRISIGFDDYGARMYFLPNDEAGYKPTVSKSGSAFVRVKTDKIERHLSGVRPSTLMGDYNLRYDDDNKAYFISIGAKK